MGFFQALFGGNRVSREQLKRYVEMEYAPEERDAALQRLLREANL